MTSKRRENINLVSFICLSFFINVIRQNYELTLHSGKEEKEDEEEKKKFLQKTMIFTIQEQ